MTYKYEAQLRTKAQVFADAIKSDLSYTAIIDPASLREYSVAIQLGEVGSATIYYSPKKNTYKLVPNNLDDALTQLLNNIWNNLPDTAPLTEKQTKPLAKPCTAYQAYVDGSYNSHTKRVGYGAIILQGDTELARLSGLVKGFAESRQIGGELEATMQVVTYSQQNDIDAIDIYYDYKGIEMWATGRWKTNKPLTQRYRAFMKEVSVKIHWHKVAAHTGVAYNEIADQLAKQGTRS